jgi:hypothetical protein
MPSLNKANGMQAPIQMGSFLTLLVKTSFNAGILSREQESSNNVMHPNFTKPVPSKT